MDKKEIDYPAEVTFKSVFRNRGGLLAEIEDALSRAGIKPAIQCRKSGNANFISYTVRAVFNSDDELQLACSEIARISGFMMMF